MSFPGYEVRLLIDGVVVASDAGSLAPGSGTFVTTTVVHTATAAEDGGTMEIELVTYGVQTNFDHVRLTVTP